MVIFLFQMQLSVFATCLFVILFLVTLKISCQEREEHKQGKQLSHVCGENFKIAWRSCCDHQCGVHAYKRALGENSGLLIFIR